MAEVDEASIPIDSANPQVAPVIQTSRTFIPLRFVLEAVNSEVIWVPEGKIIIVRYPKPTLITYENTIFSMNYPENWEKVEGSFVAFVSPEGNNINVLYEDLQAEPITLDEYTQASLELLKQMVPDMAILESSSTTLAGSPARKIIHTGSQGGLKMQITQVYLVKNDRAMWSHTVEHRDFTRIILLLCKRCSIRSRRSSEWRITCN